MIKELKNKFIETLNSKNYTQCFGAYKTDENCYCALGLLLNIVDKDGWAFENDEWKHRNNKVNWNENILNTKYKIKLSDFIHIFSMNDDCRLSFEQISRWIDKKVKSC